MPPLESEYMNPGPPEWQLERLLRGRVCVSFLALLIVIWLQNVNNSSGNHCFIEVNRRKKC